MPRKIVGFTLMGLLLYGWRVSLFANPLPIECAVAANTLPVMQKLAKQFEKNTATRIHLTPLASGTAMLHIQRGAPFDIFISADTHHPQRLYAQGYGVQPPEVYAKGVLVFWTLDPAFDLQQWKTALLARKKDGIAWAHPDLAPYGAAAVQLLKKEGLLEALQPHAIRGENVLQTTHFILKRGVVAGFSSLSLAQASQKGRWITFPPDQVPPLPQSALLLKKTRPHPHARAFYRFLFSETARPIWTAHGYL